MALIPPELKYFYMLVLTTISSLQEASSGLSQPEDDISLQHFNIPVLLADLDHVSDKRFRLASDHLCEPNSNIFLNYFSIVIGFPRVKKITKALQQSFILQNKKINLALLQNKIKLGTITRSLVPSSFQAFCYHFF